MDRLLEEAAFITKGVLFLFIGRCDPMLGPFLCPEGF